MASSITMEEMDKEGQAAKAPDLSAIKLDGADVPEHLRGKTVAEMLAYANSRDVALRTSEEARQNATRIAALEAKAAAPPPPAPVVPVAPAPPADLTLQELEELASKEGTGKAIAAAMEQTMRKATQSFNARVEPLVTSSYGHAEAEAKRKYASDFELLGPEIQTMVNEIPQVNRTQALSDIKSWDAIVTYVRGQNMDKIVERQVETIMAKRLGDARGEQKAGAAPVLGVGGSDAIGQAAAAHGRGPVWDATTIDIARQTGFDPDTEAGRREYAKWFNAGQNFITDK